MRPLKAAVPIGKRAGHGSNLPLLPQMPAWLSVVVRKKMEVVLVVTKPLAPAVFIPYSRAPTTATDREKSPPKVLPQGNLESTFRGWSISKSNPESLPSTTVRMAAPATVLNGS
jgi:hypothetical protein